MFLRWWVEQPGWQHAQRVRTAFLAGELGLVTPDFTRVELAEVLRKRGLLDGLFDERQYLVAVGSLDALGVELVALSADDLVRAAALGARHSLRIFDALAAALALDRGIRLLTADARCARAVAGVVEVEVLEGISA